MNWFYLFNKNAKSNPLKQLKGRGFVILKFRKSKKLEERKDFKETMNKVILICSYLWLLLDESLCGFKKTSVVDTHFGKNASSKPILLFQQCLHQMFCFHNLMLAFFSYLRRWNNSLPSQFSKIILFNLEWVMNA